MTVLDPALDDIITQIAPQVLSLLAGVIAGAAGTGLTLAVIVNKKKHEHSKETNYIAHWLAINICVLALGAMVFVATQVAFQQNSLFTELKTFGLGLLDSSEIALAALVMGSVGAAVTALVGYRSQHKKIHRQHVTG